MLQTRPKWNFHQKTKGRNALAGACARTGFSILSRQDGGVTDIIGSLTLPVINMARCGLFVLSGPGKKEERISCGDGQSLRTDLVY